MFCVRRAAQRVQQASARAFSSAPKPQGPWQAYLALLERSPLPTKVVTSAGIAGLGDITCQTVFEDHPFDAKRFAIFTTLGGVYIAPTLHVWYGFLNRAIAGTAKTAVAKRLVLDQFVFAPTFMASFFAVLTATNDSEVPLADRIRSKISTDWWDAVKTNWVVWIPAQFCNFGLVPPPLQVLFSNVVGLFWNGYMSYISYKPAPKEIADETK
ncbi:hypothetical protein SDRG_14090 [Saprolegnia diclina VS20]|uniref:Uncharacterized protein n=1 Tax=Saprolegnia diclina (strain VS20) TaxID=1156394 RepID=T0Q3Y0_SAPDV|nr:hypothetical protein SDRG_14090 [Saprolegnia diclina VS20]EQC28130.1 hypothetical protein SDRG_14090 [Saprolegnia diclina VS20]|eukprot:XP_008618416.1 hypothetical protein SDRG_14090 [Saprolegnia diclina VS20]